MPILATISLPPDAYSRRPDTFKVIGQLHYIRGNSAPYFSLTCESREHTSGAAHDEIKKHFGIRFDDLAALHLADIDGVPMHAEANGLYWLAGSLGGIGQQYHGGNSKGHHGGEYREPTPGECLEIFRKSWRLTQDESIRIQQRVRHADLDQRSAMRRGVAESFKDIMADEAKKLAPRWRAEADATIENHKLKVEGDNIATYYSADDADLPLVKQARLIADRIRDDLSART